MLPLSFSSIIQFLALLFLTGNLLFANATTPPCSFQKPEDVKWDWQKPDTSKGQVEVNKLSDNVFVNGPVESPIALLKLYGQEIFIQTNLPYSGRLLLVEFSTDDKQHGYVYIKDVDTCKGSILNSGVNGEHPGVIKVVIKTLKGVPRI